MNDADIKHCVCWEVRHLDNSQVILGLIGDCSIQLIKTTILKNSHLLGLLTVLYSAKQHLLKNTVNICGVTLLFMLTINLYCFLFLSSRRSCIIFCQRLMLGWTNGNPTPTTSPSFYRPDALPAAQPNMEAQFELWVWQSGRSCDRTGASEPPLRLTADAMVSVRVVCLSFWRNQRPLTRQWGLTKKQS